jgi:hypothetical protein
MESTPAERLIHTIKSHNYAFGIVKRTFGEEKKTLLSSGNTDLNFVGSN